MTISVTVGFREDVFSQSVVEEFLNKNSLKIISNIHWHDEFLYKCDPVTHLDNISSIFNGLVEKRIGLLKKNKSEKDALIKLLENRFYLDFNVSYKNDPLERMSPGKRSLVLLKLLIDLSNEEWPILLDQPDDDLDNRSVYDDLVAFLKIKKKRRQIIIVTHNPNLVVGADAEEVVVANQDGQEVGRDNPKFKFEYVSGALENSFELTSEIEKFILYRKGIRQHVYEILEGGEEAFRKREQKYDFPK